MTSYLEDVESLFLSAVRKGLSLRVSDLEIVRDWDRRRVPIDVVSRGILYGIQRFLAQAEPDAPVPASLKYYRTAVEKEFQTWERAAARGLAMTSAVPQTARKAGPDLPLTERARNILLQRISDATGATRDVYAEALNHYDAAVKSTPLADLLFQVEDMVVAGLGKNLGDERLAAIPPPRPGRRRPPPQGRGRGRSGSGEESFRKAVAPSWVFASLTRSGQAGQEVTGRGGNEMCQMQDLICHGAAW